MKVRYCPLGGEVQRHFRFRTEAGDKLVAIRPGVAIQAVRHFNRVDQPAVRRDLVEIDGRGDAEAAVVDIVIENGRIGSVVRRARRGRTSASRAGAVGRKHGSDDNVARFIVVNGTADDQVSRPEFFAVAEWKVLGCRGKLANGVLKATAARLVKSAFRRFVRRIFAAVIG